jgi:nickel/cobalt exporter
LSRTRSFWLLPIIALGAVALATFSGGSRSASAHPLGNFTINHYDRIDVSETGIQVYRILDMAEIPTFQERQKIDANGDGTVDAAESEAWAAANADELRSHITLSVNGRSTTLSDVSHAVTFPEGQGGLLLTRLEATYRADLPQGWRDAAPKIAFTDDNYGDRIGWREVVVRGGPGVDVVDSNAPAQDVSNELLNYPQNSLSSPLDVRSAAFSFKPGVGGAPVATTNADHALATRGNKDTTLSSFSDLIAKDHLSVGVVILALLAAMGFGAIHALSPGHGKTIVAAYMVGSRGTPKHALLLGFTVTATHTSSVYALGFITLYLSEYIVPETLYPWLGIISGGLIVVMGLSLFIGRLRSSGLIGQTATWVRSRGSMRMATAPRLALATSEAGAMVMMSARAQHEDEHSHEHDQDHAASHAHDGDEHRHGEEHSHADASEHKHGWGPSHSHAIPGQDGEPVTWRRLVGLGIFGGLLPCPSAIVVMLSAIALHRVGFGLVLILAFSLGLAGVLTGIGFALVYARAITQRVPLLGRIASRAEQSGGLTALAVRSFPVASAFAVIAAGLVISLRALSQQGFL